MRCGIVGAGRTRMGLGPFLASFVAEAGGEVVGVAGRSADRAAHAAAELAERLGHPVAAHGSVAELLDSGLDALVIAAPDTAHLAALQAAAAAAVPVLCEKPVVAAEQHGELAAVLARFRANRVLLMEQCQWPFVLAAFDQLFPAVAPAPTRVGMRLSPSEPGAATLRSSLSHLLSVLQARVTVGGDAEVRNLEFEGRGGITDGLTTRFDLHRPGCGPDVRCHLELRVCPEQPRPAWVEIDGQRMERVIDLADYRISFVAGERTVSVDDPARTLVYRFVDSVRAPNIERTTAESELIEHRARLYQAIIRRFVEHLADRH